MQLALLPGFRPAERPGNTRIPSPYAADRMRKWLMLRVLQEFAFYCIFPLTFCAYQLYSH